jgi:hypothetical protein
MSRMLPRFEYVVEIAAPVAEVWREFSNINRLDGKGTYHGAAWVAGEAWQKGSRLRIDMVRPFPIPVAAVVSNCNPPYNVELLNHCIGLTTTEWVRFDPVAGGTIARMIVEVVGKSWVLPDGTIHDLVPKLLKESMDALREACEALSTAH